MAEFYSATIRKADRFHGPVLLRDLHIAEQAVLLGFGIGFFPVHEAEKRPDLIEVVARQEDWQVQLWLVTHVDLHRSAKVQSFLKVLKDERDSG